MSFSKNNSNCDLDGHKHKLPFLIGVAGGTSSGKTSVCERIVKNLKEHQQIGKEIKIISLSQESFYRELTTIETKQAEIGMFNFDHPDALDFDLMLSCLCDIREQKITKVPVYDFKTNSHVRDNFLVINPCDVVLVEGILAFYHKEIMEMFDMKLFLDTDSDIRLSRRVQRDIDEHGRGLEQVLHQYKNFVKPAFEEFCVPTKKYADIIIPGGAENKVAIKLVSQHAIDVLRNNGKCLKQQEAPLFFINLHPH